MCSIIAINHHYKGFPLVIASNRDEDIARPSSGVQLLSNEPIIIGGRDELKGGTWLAVNGHSLFVGITNQGITNPDLETRGKIVMEALRRTTLRDLIQFVEEINPSMYNGFNLVFGNQEKVFLAHSYILHSMIIKELPKGVHTISDDIIFNRISSKSTYIHSKLDKIVDKEWLEYYKILKRTLANTDYVRIKQSKDSAGKCTVSSSILAFSEQGLSRYKFYDRTKSNLPANKRYKDYINLFNQNPDEKPVSEESGDDCDSDPEKIATSTFITDFSANPTIYKSIRLKY
jgi:uncharacterized protein with NRDE domain